VTFVSFFFWSGAFCYETIRSHESTDFSRPGQTSCLLRKIRRHSSHDRRSWCCLVKWFCECWIGVCELTIVFFGFVNTTSSFFQESTFFHQTFLRIESIINNFIPKDIGTSKTVPDPMACMSATQTAISREGLLTSRPCCFRRRSCSMQTGSV
jgi:hypothetical protein